MRHRKAAAIVTGCLLAVGSAAPAVAAPQEAQPTSRSTADGGDVRLAGLPQIAD